MGSQTKTYKLRRRTRFLCGAVLFVALYFLTWAPVSLADDDTRGDMPHMIQKNGENFPTSPFDEKEEESNDDALLLLEPNPSEEDNPQNNQGGGFFDDLKRFFGAPSGNDTPDADAVAPSEGCAPTPEQLEELYKEYEML